MKSLKSTKEPSFDLEELKVSGIKVNYYFVCKRKLWLFSKGLGLEGSSERVALGKLLHLYSYPKEKKRELLINNTIRIDELTNLEIKEIKLSSKLEDAAKWQVYYYLYYLKRLGIERNGTVSFPKERKILKLELTQEIEEKVERVIKAVKEIENLPKPPKAEKKPYCKSCAYYELCFVE